MKNLFRAAVLTSLFYFLTLNISAQEIDQSRFGNPFTIASSKNKAVLLLEEAKKSYMEEYQWLKENEKASDSAKASRDRSYTKKREAIFEAIRKEQSDFKTKHQREKVQLEASLDKAYSKYEKAIERKSGKTIIAKYQQGIIDIQDKINSIEQQDLTMDQYAKYAQSGIGTAMGMINNEPADFEDSSDLKSYKAPKLSDYAKKPVILVFYANKEKTSYATLKALSSTFKTYTAQKKIGFIGVHVGNDKTELKKDIQKKAFTFPIAFDNERSIREDYSVRYLPQVVYIGEDGIVKNVWVGYNSKIKSEIRSYLNDFSKSQSKKSR